MAEFLIYRNDLGEFHWYLVADGGSKIAGSEKNYESFDACRRAIDTVRETAPEAAIIDRSDSEPITEVQLRETGAAPAAHG